MLPRFKLISVPILLIVTVVFPILFTRAIGASLNEEIAVSRKAESINNGIPSNDYIDSLFEAIDKCYRTGSFDEAEKVALSILKNSEEGSFACFAGKVWIGVINIAKAEYDKAEGELKAAISGLKNFSQEPYKRVYIWALYSLGDIEAKRKNYKEAICKYSYVLEHYSSYKYKDDLAGVKLRLASVYQQDGQFSQAEAVLIGLLKDKGISGENRFKAKFMLAKFYNANSQYIQSLKIYNELISEYPNDKKYSKELEFIKENFFVIRGLAEYERIKGFSDTLSKNSKGDFSVRLTSLQAESESLFACNLSGNIYLEDGKYDLAIAEFKKALSYDPSSLIAHTGLKDAYIGKGEYIIALVEFNKLEKLSSASPDSIAFRPAYYNLDNIYTYFAQSEIETRDIYLASKAMLVVLPKHHWHVLYAALGGIYFQRGLYQDSEKFFKKSISCQMPHNMHRDFGYAGLGMVYLKKGLVGEAIKKFQIALSLEPDSRFSYKGLGIAYDRYLNKPKDAVFFYKKFFELGGVSAEIKKRLLELEGKEARNG